MKQLTIIGGTDGFGFWLAKSIAANFSSVEVTITGRNEEKGNKCAGQIGGIFMRDNIEAVKNADIVIFSAPIDVTMRVIEEVGKYIPKHAIVADVTSIKEKPARAMKEFVHPDCLVIPTHPMFGPFLQSIEGQVVVLTPDEKDSQDSRYRDFKNLLEKFGPNIVECSPIEHDKMMAVVQGLTHYNMFVLADTLQSLGVDISMTHNFISPIYKILISSVGRYVYQSPELYASIQMENDQVLDVHKVYIDSSEKFHKLAISKDKAGFVSTVNESKKYFGDHAGNGQKYTDKLIHLLGRESKKLFQNIGNEVILENIYGGETHRGILQEVTTTKIILADGELVLDEWVLSE